MKMLLFSFLILPALTMQAQDGFPAQKNIEQEILRLVNAYRSDLNKQPLQYDAVLYAQALAHAKNMAEGKTAFGHEGFEHRVRMVARTRTIKAMAENVALLEDGTPNLAQEAVKAWLESPGHRKNMEGDFTHTAIAVYRLHGYIYFVQLFASYH
ncbi:MAG: hypothetical protein KatS3mg033_0818 [Thermonema sp.]|uniref:CAP domain-containing protein n=1 Tax=Thermonema sp. TaxID=2231181 RepID=UPI0021DEB7A8|nr:CAP domain-containing protein [Thermonema sp.]GIV39018.1 MAG: hypothetical protein KatS3mg033_0818 [Thermonema sp.]